MPYTTEDGGRLNNFAAEPKMYKAAPPTKRQQVQFTVLGIGGLLLVSGLVFIAASIS